jgi:hypothetical protein
LGSDLVALHRFDSPQETINSATKIHHEHLTAVTADSTQTIPRADPNTELAPSTLTTTITTPTPTISTHPPTLTNRTCPNITMANNPKKINVTISEAENRMSQDLRNNIYSALLSGDGIRNIEGTLDRQLAESGFKDELRRYITDLFRSGQATTALEARALAMAKIREQMQGGTDDDDQPNGVNGTNGEEQKYNLKIPTKAVVEGTKTVRKELEKVCEITEDDP